MSFDLEGNNIVVTGAAKGIGLAMSMVLPVMPAKP